jgi:nitronate monooxygenase
VCTAIEQAKTKRRRNQHATADEGGLNMALPTQLDGRLTLPVIAAPMFLVSWPELVVEACRAGVLGTFPALNARSTEELRAWLEEITAALAPDRSGDRGPAPAPYGINIIAHRTNPRVEADMALVVEYEVPVVITSVGKPDQIVEAVHGYGGVVLHDVTTIDFAKRAADGGVDGVIPVCAGAGGHAGTLNPFAAVPQIREFFDGVIALAGCISDGRGVRAAETLGADLAYIGTRFIATKESVASPAYKQMLIDCEAADLLYTSAFSGIPATMLRPSIVEAGLDPDRLPSKTEIDLGEEFNHQAQAWRDIWTAGQGVGSIHDQPPIRELVARMKREYEARP